MSEQHIIIGIDEAGRGPLAGPVTAAACFIPENLEIPNCIADSKSLDEHQREEAFSWIQEYCTYGIASRSASVIDSIGILEATNAAMQEAVAKLTEYITPTFLLIDGRDQFWFDYPHTSIIKGDEKEPCISAASILAKVTRDREMVELSNTYPEYGFEKHKGYGTPEHQTAIQKNGLCPIHRRSYCKT